MNRDADSVEVTYERDGQEYTATIVPRQLEGDSMKRMGIRGSTANTKAGLVDSVKYVAYTLRYWVNYTFDCLRMLVTGQIGIKQMSGPVGIVNFVDDTYKQAAPSGAATVILNLLPIPALDGGRLVFLIVEAVRRKRVPPEKEGMVHIAGFALLMVLMVVVLFNDIRNIF